MTNGVAFGIGVGIGLVLSLAVLVLWASPLRPTGPAGGIIALFVGLVIPVVGAIAMPTLRTGVFLLLGYS